MKRPSKTNLLMLTAFMQEQENIKERDLKPIAKGVGNDG